MAMIEQFAAVSETTAGARLLVIDAINREFWRWYVQRAGDVILERRVLFFTVKVHLRDLRGIFALVFGPEAP